MSDEWARKEAAEFLAREQARELKSEKDLSDRKMKQVVMGDKWNTLGTLVAHKVMDFNKQIKREALTYEVTGDRQVAAGRTDNHTNIQLSADPSLFRVIVSMNRITVKEYTLQSKGGDEFEFKASAGSFVSVEEIAETTLSILLRSGD